MFLVYITIPLFPILFFPKKKLLRKLTLVVTFLFVVISTFLSLFFPVFTFQKLIGEYGIGTTTYHFVDKSRSELFGEDTSRKRN